jgi:hypothetical protein
LEHADIKAPFSIAQILGEIAHGVRVEVILPVSVLIAFNQSRLARHNAPEKSSIFAELP